MEEHRVEKKQVRTNEGGRMRRKGIGLVRDKCPVWNLESLLSSPHPVGLGCVLAIHVLIAVSPLGDLSFGERS